MRQCLRAGWGESSEAVRLLYGGSVSGANVRGFLGQAVIDGALVGGLSLDPVEFARIVEAARSLET
jgi:triosephosphate isomerase